MPSPANDENETIEFRCPGCNETSTLSKTVVGQFMPCPSCGLSVAVDVSEAGAPREVEPTAMQRAYRGQREASRVFQETAGLLQVDFRVFRLKTFGDWESLFEEATGFANTLAPEALINISHSGGEGYGTNAVTVWYWRKQPVQE